MDKLRDQLERAGVKQVGFDPVPMERWTTTEWSLDLTSGSGAGPVRTAAYIPYSGTTSGEGVSGELVYVEPDTTPAPGSLAGKIALFEVPLSVVPLSFFIVLGYPGRVYDPNGELVPTAPYKRPYLNGVVPVLEALEAAGAIGAVGILDYPAEGADGSYFPYDGIIRNIPSLYVDRSVGASLKVQAETATTARLALPAKVKQVKSRNLIGFIPGRSREIVALHCHTDGSNAIEDNGPMAIVAMAQYMARLPRQALPRTIMILLTTGHFAGGNGARSFCERHEDGMLKRINAALTIEHLGLEEWDELPGGGMGPTGRFEPGAVFAPGSEALVSASFKALERGEAAPAGVLRPLNPDASGTAHEPAWPGEGQYLYSVGGLPTANYITGPAYLLNWGIETADKVRLGRFRDEAIAFTEMTLRLARKPREKLTTYTL